MALMPVADALAAVLAGAEALPEEMVALGNKGGVSLLNLLQENLFFCVVRGAYGVGALEREATDYSPGHGGGAVGVATAAWAPTAPAILLDTEFPEPSEYEVNIYKQDEFRLVAAIELVSPSNQSCTAACPSRSTYSVMPAGWGSIQT